MKTCLNCYYFVFEYDLAENDLAGRELYCLCHAEHWSLQPPQYADTFRATLKAAETCDDYAETP